MNAIETAVRYLGMATVAAPALLLAFFGLAGLLGRVLTEVAIARAVRAAVVTGMATSLAIGALLVIARQRHVPVEIGDWVVTVHYHFQVKLLFDALSVPYVVLTFLLCGTIGSFATRYLHRESGYGRFFVLFALFQLGMVTAALSDTIETLFAGWEMVGLSSVLLIAFFHERPAPVRNGLRVWCVYRFCDASLMLAAVYLHQRFGAGDFDHLVGVEPWPSHGPVEPHPHTLLLGLLFLVAAAGKSALVPFSGWLPRAMEGPTPSSAVYYGALSVHLGVFLLLRVSPLLESEPLLTGLVVALGATTAVYAYMVGGVQTDIKSALSFAALAQVGIIVVEIGFGLRTLALIHLLGHACLRTLQFVRAPTLLHDIHTMENAIGARLPRPDSAQRLRRGGRLRAWIYRFALERGYLDAAIDRALMPLAHLVAAIDSLERRVVRAIFGGLPR